MTVKQSEPKWELEAAIDRLVSAALEKGWRIGYHRHPKTKANWDKQKRRK